MNWSVFLFDSWAIMHSYATQPYAPGVDAYAALRRLTPPYAALRHSCTCGDALLQNPLTLGSVQIL